MFLPHALQVHLIVGLGDQESTVPVDKRGHMDDVAASPNDPFFYIHHTMVDCIFQTWRTANPNAQYPVSVDPSQFPIADGHKKDDYSRGWLPLYKNSELFAQAENFGYTCALADIPAPPPPPPPPSIRKRIISFWTFWRKYFRRLHVHG